ncbi:MFS transporter [Bartonella sp. HY329]|uniref:MFS transporter n=1 Tax=unclassified Bartonella TaxID=2645622 RepID=UPI0021C87517|nr:MULTISPECIES: MFS transporter [unclassified Bartonella]UXM95352.1 MFS transporter [Bartonella sp. HY329]UXN09677.1 MFS transporter [Bartonella sp. HY328]
MHEEAAAYWKTNIIIVTLGAFTTIVGMTLLLPILPLYIADLGIDKPSSIASWSGITYGITYFAAAFVAPLWGRLGDLYGRKLMLVRASFGMAISIALMGMATSIEQLFFLRLLTGLAGGYASGAAILAATQAPRDQTGWAIGLVSSGIMAGNFLGPLIGGILPIYIGIRASFWVVGLVIFVTFLATTFMLKENKSLFQKRNIPDKAQDKPWRSVMTIPVIIALTTAMLLMFANMSIEPIITLYVQQLLTIDVSHLQIYKLQGVTFWAGIIMSVTALGSALSAKRLGSLADKIGYQGVLIVAMLCAGLLLVPQAFVTSPLQLAILRFFLGVALGGLIPCITASLRQNISDDKLGTVLGLSVSCQYVGQVLGPLMGGYIGGYFGMEPVFFITALVLILCALGNVALLVNKK